MVSLESLEVSHGVSSSEGAFRLFSMRVVNLDYYMATPLPSMDICYSQFQGRGVLEVPVIRVYGSTLACQKACMHIHKVFPYFYVPYDEDLPQKLDDALTFVRHLALAIEKAMKFATNIGAKRQHVHSCCLVRGRRFYGFHHAEQLFIKLTLYYPQEVIRISALLSGGGILNRKFQPYESHIPYLLQFMVDYNLHGMSHMHITKLVFRQPLPEKPRETSYLLKSVVNWAEAIVRQQGSASDTVLNSSHFVSKARNVSAADTAFYLHGTNKEAEIGSGLDKAQDFWLKSNIPSDWAWPSFTSDGGQDFEKTRSPFRMSKSELEADASAEDILNKKELQYIPLCSAGPNVKMVQSLAPIWEEEYLRNGNHVPAASDVNQPSLKRVLASSKFSQDNLKKSLLEVIAQETMHAFPVEGSFVQERPDGLNSWHHHHHALRSLPEVAPAERDTISGTSAEWFDREKTLLGSPEAPSLYEVTQVAYGVQLPIQKGEESMGEETFQTDTETGTFHEVTDSPFPLNEELIKMQLTESQLKEEEKEALDFLQWMMDDVDEGENEVENTEDTANLSQIVKAEGVEAILKKSLCNYEVSSQQECENILECFEDFFPDDCDTFSPTGDLRFLNKAGDVQKEKLTLVTESTTCKYSGNTAHSSETRISEHSSGKIPQSDGAFDEGKNFCESPRDENDLTLNSITSQGHAHLAKDEVKVEMHRKPSNSLPVAESSNKWGSLPVITGGNQSFRSDTIRLSEENEHIDKAFAEGDSAKLNRKLNVMKKHKKGCAHLSKITGMVEQKSSCQRFPNSGGLDNLSVRDLMRYKRAKKPFMENTKALGEKNSIEHIKKETAMQISSESEAVYEETCAKTQEQGTMPTSPNVFEDEAPNDFHNINLPCTRFLEHCPGDCHILTFHKQPPSKVQLLRTFQDFSIRPVDYGTAYYGDVRDIPARASVMAGLVFDVKSRSSIDLCDFHFGGKTEESGEGRPYIEEENWGPQEGTEDLTGGYSYYENDGTLLFLLTPVQSPPLLSSLSSADKAALVNSSKQFNMSEELQDNSEEFLEFFRPASPKYDEKHVLNYETPLLDQGAQNSSIHPPQARDTQDKRNSTFRFTKQCNQHDAASIPRERFSKYFSQITAPSITSSDTTPLSQAGFRDPATLGGDQQVTLISVEMHAQTRGDLRPDPRYDSICCITIVIQSDSLANEAENETVVLLCDDEILLKRRDIDGCLGCKVIILPDEVSLLQCFARIVSVYDPDMIIGWEIQGFSLGFLAERAANLGIGILKQISRSIKISQCTTSHTYETEVDLVEPNESSILEDEWGRTHGSGIHISGRIVLNLWRIIRGELKLNIYTLEAVAEAVLRRRVPRIPWNILTQWFLSGPGRERFRCVEYLVECAQLNLKIMNQLDLVNRTAELARIFGIDFFSVLSRGSQYRVESMMLRLAHTQNFLLISPTRQQVFAQPAMECLPLVMEPESRFFTSPVVVLDFQSLYPSIIIAYNLCFSTCLGKIGLSNPKVLGVTSLSIEHGLLSKLKDILTIAPNGVLYVPPEVHPGVLPRLLQEILSTRIMVKQTMKNLSSSQKVMQRVLNARQAALKLISNVTYGYTAAGFSGRMPCAELADSIVQFGRHTLEQAIQLVNKNPQWDAHVVYGDTDSMFVLLEGRTRDEAFKIGQDIATVVTKSNPYPVTLKMEKVYHPCVLLTKKRYVGYSFESPSQTKPKFDAKGIETVRRDSCSVVAKCMERSLRILFESNDLSEVKQYLERQLQKILQGRVSIRDFIFAKEVRLGTYSAKASVLPPAAIVASKAMTVDPRAEPRFGERVQYVVVHGEPGARLVDMVVDPHILLDNPGKLRLHDTYYINKQILPALQRIFGLLGVDLRGWYSEMSRVYRPSVLKRPLLGATFLNASVRKGDLASKKTEDRLHARATIDQYYLSQHCTVCGELTKASQAVCSSCSENQVAVATILTRRCSQMEKEFNHLLALCRHCGGSRESYQQTIACISLECPVFYERRKVETLLESASYLAVECGLLPRKPAQAREEIQ